MLYFIEGQYEKMAAVLRGMTNAPVFLPADLVERRPVRRTGRMFATRWRPWGHNRRQGQQHRLLGGGKSRDAIDDRSVGDDSGEESDPSECNRLARTYDGGVMQVLCPGDDLSLRQSTAVLVVVWFTLSYGTYGVATWNNQLFSDIGLSNPYLCSFIFALSNLPGNVASVILVERVSDGFPVFARDRRGVVVTLKNRATALLPPRQWCCRAALSRRPFCSN